MKLKGDRIFWDLDGVLRDLHYKFLSEGEIGDWYRVNDEGKTVMEYVEEDLDVLVDAPECEYMEIAKQFDPIHIVSTQPDIWRPYTSRWLDSHLPDARVKYLLDTNHKLRYLEAGTRVLVDDYPLFSDYTHIILVDRPYNQEVECKIRVHNPEELMVELRRFIDGKNMGRA